MAVMMRWAICCGVLNTADFSPSVRICPHSHLPGLDLPRPHLPAKKREGDQSVGYARYWCLSVLPPGMTVPLPGLGVLLGQDDDCEFGVCRIVQSGASIAYSGTVARQIEGQVILLARDFFRGVKIWTFGRPPNERLIGVGPIRIGAHQLTWGDWCGPGGSGPNLGSRDAACHVHDTCYDDYHLAVVDNFNKGLNSEKAKNLQRCNQELCDAASGNVIRWYFSGVGSNSGAQCH